MNPYVADANAKLEAGGRLTGEEILRVLVGFDTVSSRSNMELIEWVEHYLAHYEVASERVQEKNEDGVPKSSLLAHIGPRVPGGIVLSGHTDVVPVKGQQWTGGQGDERAFHMAERDGKLYGRGTADMKGFIALALAQVPEFVAQEKAGELKRPVWFAFSHDEEIGCKCAELMAKDFTAREIKPQLIVVGEPTMMKVVDEHKGIDGFETKITGVEGHSSEGRDDENAAYLAAELALTVRDINRAERARAEKNSRFPVPHGTAHVGVLEAGDARNINPAKGHLLWEVRPMPGQDVSTMIKSYEDKIEQLRAAYPSCTIENKRLSHVHGLKRQENAPDYLNFALSLAGTNETSAVNYGTEGGAMGEEGFPTVICGPGDIAQAHRPDEFVSRDQLQRGANMMARIGEALTKPLWTGRGDTSPVNQPQR